MNNWEHIESAFGLLEEELTALQRQRELKAAELAEIDRHVEAAQTLLRRMVGVLDGSAPPPVTPAERRLEETALQKEHSSSAPPPLMTEPCCRLTTASGETILLDPEDYEWAKNHIWYYDRNGKAVYRKWGEDGREARGYLHRLVMGSPSGFVVAENGNRLDCRLHNLRVMSAADRTKKARAVQQAQRQAARTEVSVNGAAV